MAKKIKKRPVSPEPVDPNLENVGEDRAFEVEIDEGEEGEPGEIVFVHHYRRKWGDDFDADVEHGLNLDEARALMGVLFSMINVLEQKASLENIVEEKSTPSPVEKNPLKDNSVQ